MAVDRGLRQAGHARNSKRSFAFKRDRRISSMQKSVGTNFSKLPVEDPETGDVLAVIETSRGSRNKYAFDLDLGAFRLKSVLPQGNVFPFDFGFIPSTKADDGDP